MTRFLLIALVVNQFIDRGNVISGSSPTLIFSCNDIFQFQ